MIEAFLVCLLVYFLLINAKQKARIAELEMGLRLAAVSLETLTKTIVKEQTNANS